MSASTESRRRLTLPMTMRIRRHREFDQAMRGGLRVSDHRLTIWVRCNALEYPRLGLIVGRRHGGAVRRNRLKRLIREAFRLCQHELPVGVDIIVTPSPTHPLQLANTQAALVQLAERAARRLSRS